MVIKNWQNQQNSFIFHMTPIAYEEKHCKIAQYCVYVLLSYFVFREKLREGRTKLPGSEVKGQLISECLFDNLKSSKKSTKDLTNFCPRI